MKTSEKEHELKPAVGKEQKPTMAVICLHSEDGQTLMVKGHHEPSEFLEACAKWNEEDMARWGEVKHGWWRTVPDRSGEYATRVMPAKPHARGAYPATTISDE